jgi:NADPH-dependent 2,4-dienoyl-CoA reductase/sulfur reductase-like enzyme
LTVDQGVLCDATCAAAPGIVAAGDVARWPNPRYGELRRVEHWDNAIRQGRHAARRLLAEDGRLPVQDFEPVPWFWSDQFGAKLQLAGTAHAFDEFAVLVGSLGSYRFVGAYRRGDRVIGAVSLNAAKPMVGLRRLLERRAPWTDVLDVAASTSR